MKWHPLRIKEIIFFVVLWLWLSHWKKKNEKKKKERKVSRRQTPFIKSHFLTNYTSVQVTNSRSMISLRSGGSNYYIFFLSSFLSFLLFFFCYCHISCLLARTCNRENCHQIPIHLILLFIIFFEVAVKRFPINLIILVAWGKSEICDLKRAVLILLFWFVFIVAFS